MVFSSFEFLFRFLPFFLLIYYVTPQKWKNAVLFAGSILFYTAGEAEYVVLLLASVVINYVFGRLMYRDTYEGRGKKQLILLIVALCYDFGVLFLFKYSGFMDKLPLGISFYTFQIAAYIIDVYRGRVPVEKSFIRLGTYVTMFPQLIAGPIINYSEVRMALCSRTVTFEQFESGLKILILGLGAKVIVADRIGLLWNNIQAIGFESISTPLAWMGAFAYSIELYFDFSGYSLMALGLGRMLALKMLGELEQDPSRTVSPYFNKSSSDSMLRSCTIPITGEHGRIIGLLCINFHMEMPLSEFLQGMLPSQDSSSVTQASSETFSDNIDDLILFSLTETKESVYNDPGISSSNKNKEIIFRLYQQGIFNLKDAVIKVANQLNISKNTVYMHIRNFKVSSPSN